MCFIKKAQPPCHTCKLHQNSGTPPQREVKKTTEHTFLNRQLRGCIRFVRRTGRKQVVRTLRLTKYNSSPAQLWLRIPPPPLCLGDLECCGCPGGQPSSPLASRAAIGHTRLVRYICSLTSRACAADQRVYTGCVRLISCHGRKRAAASERGYTCNLTWGG